MCCSIKIELPNACMTVIIKYLQSVDLITFKSGVKVWPWSSFVEREEDVSLSKQGILTEGKDWYG